MISNSSKLMENNTDLTASHRRSQSDAAGLLDVAAGALQDTPQAPGHVRSVSLGSSASQFLQSLKLQDPAALQHSLQATADQLALTDQHTPHAEGSTLDAHAASAGKAAAAAVAQDRSAGQSARSKRTHRSSNGRASKDAMQLDVAAPEQLPHGFTPLPAVVENSPFDDSERDWDSDSDQEGYGPNRRGSRAGGRRGGCNGRSESELMLLDPKRVKRILANRESAQRSKERRMNYTMELEGKLHDLSLEADKLNSQLHTLSKQEGKLRVSKADLEQQVHSMQQQLAQVVSDNQTLMGTLFELQAALGLPQALPDCVMPAGMQGAAADAYYQQSWQAYPEQQYPDSAQVAGTKQRKPRRQSKQDKQQPHYAWGGSGSYACAAEADLNDPAAAAAAPVAELPVRPVRSVLPAAAAPADGQAAGQAHMEAAAAAGPAAAAGAHAGGAVGVSALHAVVTTRPPSSGGGSGVLPLLQVSPRQHQWHTGLGGSNSNTTPAATPQLQAAGASAAFAPAAAAGVAPRSAAAAAAAGDAAGLLLLGQLPSPGADAVMGDAEDDIAMLGAFLEEDDAIDGAAGAGAVMVSTAAPAGLHSQQDAAAAAAATTLAVPAAGAAAAGGVGANSIAGSSLPSHRSFQAAAGMPTAVAGTFMLRSSPALSDPAGVDVWRDDVSTGSVGGSLTHSHTPNLTPNSGQRGAEGLTGVSPAYAAAGGWQQPPHHQQQQHQRAGRTAVVSPPAAAGGNFVPPAPITAAQVSPITPSSGRVPTPGSQGQAGSTSAAAAGMAAYPADPVQANPVQQQQAGVNFVMGANPAANWRGGRHVRSASTGCVSGLGWHGYDQFVLPTSSELMLQEQQQQQQGGDMLAVQQQGSSILAAQHHHHHHQQQQQDRHVQSRGHGSVVTTAMGLPPMQGHVSMPEVTLAAFAASSGMAAECLGQDNVGAGPGMGQGPWQRHRRSHSHAAAFMGQYQLPHLQQQQAYGSMAAPHGPPLKPEL